MSPWGSKAKGSQRAYSVRKRRNLLHVARGSDHHRELAASLQHHQAACIARLQATSPRGVRACIRRVAGCATSTGFAGHASTEAGLELTFHLDHPMGPHHPQSADLELVNAVRAKFRRPAMKSKLSPQANI